jgi:hypothetical protein
LQGVVQVRRLALESLVEQKKTICSHKAGGSVPRREHTIDRGRVEVPERDVWVSVRRHGESIHEIIGETYSCLKKYSIFGPPICLDIA